MDINYLLFLQDFRISIHDAWTPFMEATSLFAIKYLVLFAVFMYWCVNKRKGLYILTSFFLCSAMNAVLKLTMCVYRPWIRDPRIIPAGKAISTASGYSFPSGHTTAATPLYGGLAVVCWTKKSIRWLSVLCILALLITGFSRNYLGVHTPQDVLVGLGLGILSLWGTARLFHYLDIHPQQENRLLLIGFIAGLLALCYITYKPYPLDYVNGKLLVDPQRMMNEGYQNLGFWLAFCMARYIEKRWIRFTETGLTLKGLILCVLGLLPLALIMTRLRSPLMHTLGAHAGLLVFSFAVVCYVMVVFPWIIKKTYPNRK